MKVDFNKWKEEDDEEEDFSGGDFDFQNYMSKLGDGGAGGAPNLDDFDDDDDKDDDDEGIFHFVCFLAYQLLLSVRTASFKYYVIYLSDFCNVCWFFSSWRPQTL